MERIFIQNGEIQVFGPEGDLWLEIEEPEQFTSKDLKMLCNYEPTNEEKPLRITMDMAYLWKTKLEKIRKSQKPEPNAGWDL